MLKRTLPSLLVLLMPVLLAAQSTGTIRLLVDPGHNFEFIVDKKHRMQQREVKLMEGLHHFSFWAPERAIVDTSFFVIADKTTDMVLQLPYSKEYAAYRAQLSAFQSARRTRAWTPVLVAGGLVWTGLSYDKYKDASNALDEAVKGYHASDEPGAIYKLKNKTIPEHNAELKKAKTSMAISSVFTVASLGFAVLMRMKTKGQERPRFEDKERIRFDGLAWVPDQHGSFWMAGLSIPLDR